MSSSPPVHARPPDAPTSTTRAARPLARAGIAAALATTVIVFAMHVVGPSARVSPVRRTISEYALLPGGWVFEVAVAGLALGSAAVLGALIGARLVAPRSAPAALLVVWWVGLLLVVAFEKTNWSIGPSLAGYIHRYASLAAFLGLPVGALLLARRWRGSWRPFTRAVRMLSWVALASFVPIVIAIAARPFTGMPWWRAVPLGLLERVVSLVDVGVVVALGTWALAAARVPAAERM